MASMNDFAGQSLNWIQGSNVWELIASDGSAIARFPLEIERDPFWKSPIGFGGIRYKKAKALIPDGTGTLFLNQEKKEVRDIYIYAVEQGPRLATYSYRPDVIGVGFLRFNDGRTFQWGRVDFFSGIIDLWRHRVKRWGNGGWMDDKSNASYVEICDGMSQHRVNISPLAADMREPELSLLVVLGLYNIDFENTQRTLEGKQWGAPGHGG